MAFPRDLPPTVDAMPVTCQGSDAAGNFGTPGCQFRGQGPFLCLRPRSRSTGERIFFERAASCISEFEQHWLEAVRSYVRIPYDIFERDRAIAVAELLAMGKSTEESGLDKTSVEWAKLRVSQINNCAFCLQIHLNVSRRLGLPQEKLELGLATWHEAGGSSRARSAKHLPGPRQLTRLDGSSESDEAYERGSPALQRRRGDRAQRGDRQHQCLEPAGCRPPFRAAYSRRRWRRRPRRPCGAFGRHAMTPSVRARTSGDARQVATRLVAGRARIRRDASARRDWRGRK